MPAPPLDLPAQLRRLAAFAAVTYPFACVPFLYFHFRDHGVDLGGYGTLIACYYLAMVLCEVPTGLLADRLGPKLPLVLGPLLLAVGFLLFVVTPTFVGFCAGEAVLGVGHAMLSGPPSALLFGSLRRAQRTSDFLRCESQMHALRLAGTAVAFLAGGFLVAAGGIAVAILVTAALHLVAATIALGLQPLRTTRLRTPALLRSAAAELRAPAVLWIAGMYAILFVVLRYVFHTYQPFLEAAHAEEPIAIGVLFCAMNLVAAPCSRIVPRMHRRAGFAGMFWLVLLLLTGSLLPLSALVTQAGALLFFLHQVPFGMHWALVQDFVNQRIAPRSRTTVLSAMSLGSRLLFALLFLPLAHVQQEVGVAAAWFWVGLIGMLAGSAWLLAGRRFLQPRVHDEHVP